MKFNMCQLVWVKNKDICGIIIDKAYVDNDYNHPIYKIYTEFPNRNDMYFSENMLESSDERCGNNTGLII